RRERHLRPCGPAPGVPGGRPGRGGRRRGPQCHRRRAARPSVPGGAPRGPAPTPARRGTIRRQIMTPKFPASEFEGRLRRLQSAMAEQGLKLCLIHTPENICYLTGHETPGYYVYQCLIVPVEGAPVLVLRETEVAHAEQCP